MPQQEPDNLSQLASSIFKPIEPTLQPPQQQPSGWQGKTAGIAELATNFLAGVSKGRANAYNKSLEDQQKQVASMQTAIQAVDSSDATQEVKNQQKSLILQQMGKLIQGSLPDSKGKKGGDPQQDGGQGHPVLHAMKGMLDGLLGPAPKKNAVTPEAINATLGQVFATINDPNNTQSKQAATAEQSLSSAWAKAVEENGGPLTSAQVMKHPELVSTLGNYNRVTGGKPGPTMNMIAQSVDEADKQSMPLAQAQLHNTNTEADLHVAETEKNKADTKRIEQETKNLADGSNTKYTGELGERVNAQRIIDSPTASPDVKQAAKDTLKSLNEKQKRTEVSINLAQQKVADKAAEDAGLPKGSVQYVPGGKSIANPKGDLGMDVMAWDYINEGKVAFIGLGKGKAAEDKRSLAVSRAGEILADWGLKPYEMEAIRGRLKADKKALANMSTMQSQVEQFEGTLESNMQVAEKLDDAFKRHDVQFLNSIESAFKTGKGDPEAVNLAAQLHGISREWAKIMAGNMSSTGVAISEAKGADEIVSAKLSSGQLKSLFNDVIRVDARNRLKNVNEQRTKLIQELRDPTSEVLHPDRQTDAPPAAPKKAVAGSPDDLGVKKPGAQAAPKPPAVGTVEDGHKFLGGNPADPKNWQVIKQ